MRTVAGQKDLRGVQEVEATGLGEGSEESGGPQFSVLGSWVRDGAGHSEGIEWGEGWEM